MNELDKLKVWKIYRRIAVKRNNLKILWPEVNFLQFIDELEQFQQIIEGVYTYDSIPQVHLSTVRLKFKSLQNNYDALKKILVDSFKRIEATTNDISLKELITAIGESIVFLCTSFHNFSSGIIASTDLVYNIKAILIVRDILSDLKSEVNIVRKNFYNLQKGVCKEQAKKILTNIYDKALAASCLQFEQLARNFPKSRLSVSSTRTPNKIYMAEEIESPQIEQDEQTVTTNIDLKLESENEHVTDTQKSKSESVEVLSESGQLGQKSDKGIEELADVEENVQLSKEDENDEKNQFHDENVDNIVASDAQLSNRSGTLLASSKFSIDKLLNQILPNIHQQRTQVESYIKEITAYEIEMKEIDKTLEQQRRIFNQDLENIERQKRSIDNNVEISDDEKVRQTQDITNKTGQLADIFEGVIKNLENRKQNMQKQLLMMLATLKDLLKNAYETKQQIFENVKSSDSSLSEDDLQALEKVFDEESGIVGKIKVTEEFEVDDDGVFYVDETNAKIYITKLGGESHKNIYPIQNETERKLIQDNGTSSSTATTDQSSVISSSTVSHSRESSFKSMEEILFESNKQNWEPLHEESPLDCESYIKCNLGRPLRQALAAITIYQPTDPINYLANYLLQYRYNEMRNIERQQNFENLLVERTRYAKHAQLENICHEIQRRHCDP